MSFSIQNDFFDSYDDSIYLFKKLSTETGLKKEHVLTEEQDKSLKKLFFDLQGFKDLEEGSLQNVLDDCNGDTTLFEEKWRDYCGTWYDKHHDDALKKIALIAQYIGKEKISESLPFTVNENVSQVMKHFISKILEHAEKNDFILSKKEIKHVMNDTLKECIQESTDEIGSETVEMIIDYEKENKNIEKTLNIYEGFLQIRNEFSEKFSSNEVKKIMQELVHLFKKEHFYIPSHLKEGKKDLIEYFVLKKSQDVSHNPLITQSSLMQSVHKKEDSYQQLILPGLKGLALLFTSNVKDAKELSASWQGKLENLASLWEKAEIKESSQEDSYYFLHGRFFTFDRVQKYLSQIAQSGINLGKLLTLLSEIKISSKVTNLGLDFAAIDKKNDLIQLYLTKPDEVDLSLFFKEDSIAQDWPKELQFQLLFAVSELRKFIYSGMENPSFRDYIKWNLDGFLNIFDHPALKKVFAISGDFAIDTALRLGKSFFLKIVKPSSELEKLKEKQKELEEEMERLELNSFIEGCQKWVDDNQKRIDDCILEADEIKKTIDDYRIRINENQESIKKTKDSVVKEFCEDKIKSLEEKISVEEWKLNNVQKSVNDWKEHHESLEHDLRKYEEEAKEFKDEINHVKHLIEEAKGEKWQEFSQAYIDFMTTLISDIYDAVYYLRFDKGYQDSWTKTRDFHLYDVIGIFSGLLETLKGLKSYVDLQNKESDVEQLLDKKAFCDEQFDQYLIQLLAIVQRFATVLVKNPNHQTLIKTFDEEIILAIQKESFTSLEKDSFLEWLMKTVGIPLSKLFKE